VEVRHRALANFLAAFRRHVDLGARDVLVAVTTVSFDIAALELFLPLLCGARLVLADREAADGVALLRLLERSRATVMQATPATWQLLLEAGWEGEPRLRVLCGGEALSRPLADRLRERGAEVWNLYGPTETTIWSTLERLDGPLAAAGDDRPAPIGRPLANTRALVLGPDLRLVPLLAAGELCLGGEGLARGYRGRPDLTAERFVPDPFAPAPGARLYRTGDLARLRPDGTLEILGRLDDQIKVRGFRVEPGEIEAALLRQPEVREAAAAARRDRHGVPHLIAWVAPGSPVTPDALRRRLQEVLPEYLVPSRIAVVDRLPRTPNGKTDRRALTDPEPLAEAGRGSALAATPVERTLARIWAELLGLDAESLRLRDDFFELGGSSLLTTRLIVRVRAELGLEIPLFRVFQRPTIAGLAAWIEERRREGAVSAAGSFLALRASGARTPLFLVPPAAGSPLCYLDLTLGLSEDQPVYGFQAPGLQDGEAPLGRVEKLSALFLQELRAVQPAGPYRLGGWSFGALVALEMARSLEAAGETVEILAVIAGGGVQRAPWRQRLQLRAAARLIRSLARGLREMPWPRTYAELRALASWVGVSLPESTRPFAQGGLAARLRLVRRLAGETARSLRVSRRHLGAALRHAPAGYGGTIVLFRDLPPLPPGSAERDTVVALFRGLARGGLEVVPTPGDHMTMMMDRQNVRALARKLENRLNGLSAVTGAPSSGMSHTTQP
jgi:thioesterase domain-containing protein/acyl carrier protein